MKQIHLMVKEFITYHVVEFMNTCMKEWEREVLKLYLI
jgi:hypothetical protein